MSITLISQIASGITTEWSMSMGSRGSYQVNFTSRTDGERHAAQFRLEMSLNYSTFFSVQQGKVPTVVIINAR